MIHAAVRRAVRWFNPNELSTLLRVATVGRGADAQALGLLLAEAVAERMAHFDAWERSSWHPNSINQALDALTALASLQPPGTATPPVFLSLGLITADELTARMRGGRDRSAALRQSFQATLVAAEEEAADARDGLPGGIDTAVEGVSSGGGGSSALLGVSSVAGGTRYDEFAHRVALRVETRRLEAASAEKAAAAATAAHKAAAECAVSFEPKSALLLEYDHSLHLSDVGHGIDSLVEALAAMPKRTAALPHSSLAPSQAAETATSAAAAAAAAAAAGSLGEPAAGSGAPPATAPAASPTLLLSPTASARIAAGVPDRQRAAALIPRISRLARAASAMAVLGVPASHPFWADFMHVTTSIATGEGRRTGVRGGGWRGGAAPAGGGTAAALIDGSRNSGNDAATAASAAVVAAPTPSGAPSYAPRSVLTPDSLSHVVWALAVVSRGGSEAGGNLGAAGAPTAASIAPRNAYAAYALALLQASRRGDLSSMGGEALTRTLWAFAATGRWVVSYRAVEALVREATARLQHQHQQHHRGGSQSGEREGADALTPLHVARLAWSIGHMGIHALTPSVSGPFFWQLQQVMLQRQDCFALPPAGDTPPATSMLREKKGAPAVADDDFDAVARGSALDSVHVAMLLWGCAKARAGTNLLFERVADTVVAASDTAAASRLVALAEYRAKAEARSPRGKHAGAPPAASASSPSLFTSEEITAMREREGDGAHAYPHLRMQRWRPAEVSLAAWALATAGVEHDGFFTTITTHTSPTWWIRWSSGSSKEEGDGDHRHGQYPSTPTAAPASAATTTEGSSSSSGGTGRGGAAQSRWPTTPLLGLAGGLAPGGSYGSSGGISSGRAQDAPILKAPKEYAAAAAAHAFRLHTPTISSRRNRHTAVILHRDLTSLLHAFAVSGQMAKHHVFIARIISRLKSTLPFMPPVTRSAAAATAAVADASGAAGEGDAGCASAFRTGGKGGEGGGVDSASPYFFSTAQLSALHTVILSIKRHNGIALSAAKSPLLKPQQQQQQQQPPPSAVDAASPAPSPSVSANTTAAAQTAAPSPSTYAPWGRINKQDRHRIASSLPLIDSFPKQVELDALATAHWLAQRNASVALDSRGDGRTTSSSSSSFGGNKSIGRLDSRTAGLRDATTAAAWADIHRATAATSSPAVAAAAGGGGDTSGGTNTIIQGRGFASSVRAALTSLCASVGLRAPSWEHITNKALVVDAAVEFDGASFPSLIGTRGPGLGSNPIKLAVEFEGPLHFLPLPCSSPAADGGWRSRKLLSRNEHSGRPPSIRASSLLAQAEDDGAAPSTPLLAQTLASLTRPKHRYNAATRTKHGLLAYTGWRVAHVVWSEWPRTLDGQQKVLIQCLRRAGVNWDLVESDYRRLRSRGGSSRGMQSSGSSSSPSSGGVDTTTADAAVSSASPPPTAAGGAVREREKAVRWAGGRQQAVVAKQGVVSAVAGIAGALPSRLGQQKQQSELR